MALISDAVVRHHRPLPDIPTSEDDSGAAGGSSLLLPAASSFGGGGGLDSSMRWSSRENLLTAATDEDPQLFVALYDFQAGGENQLSLKKGNIPNIPMLDPFPIYFPSMPLLCARRFQVSSSAS